MTEPEMVSIMMFEGSLLVTPVKNLGNALAVKFKDTVLKKLEEIRVNSLILNLGNLFVVDSFLGRIIGELTNAASLMGVKVIVVGLRPDVVITLVEMGISLGQAKTSLNIDLALELLHTNAQT